MDSPARPESGAPGSPGAQGAHPTQPVPPGHATYPPYGQPPYGGYPAHPGYPAQPGYPAPVAYPVYGPPQPTNSLAIASMVVSLTGLVLGLALFPLGILCIGGVVLGHVALNQIKKAPPERPEKGREMALVGLIVGYVAIGLALLMALAVAAFIGIVANAG